MIKDHFYIDTITRYWKSEDSSEIPNRVDRQEKKTDKSHSETNYTGILPSDTLPVQYVSLLSRNLEDQTGRQIQVQPMDKNQNNGQLELVSVDHCKICVHRKQIAVSMVVYNVIELQQPVE